MLPHKSCKSIHAPDWMIIDAVRYAFGRMTYQVGVTAQWVVSHWYDLDEHTKICIMSDIESEFSRAERVGNYSHFGHECDRRDWERVRRLWRDES